MKRLLTTIQEKADKILTLAVLAGAMASCDSVLDFNEGDCSIEYRVKFKYDYNMEKASAFSKQVKTVTLYAFDEAGNFVYQKTDEGEILADENYSMTVDIEPGDYHLVTWAGLDDQSFAVPVLIPGVSKLPQLTVKTLRNGSITRAEGEKEQYVVEKELSPLWHGDIRKQAFTRSGRQQVTTIDLVKNTNNIRIVIAQVNRTPDKPVTRALQENNFRYRIYDDNGFMNYDNSLLKDNLLTYKPFVTYRSTVSTRAFTPDKDSEYQALIAEISVARLLESQTPELYINNEVLKQPLLSNGSLISYLNLLRLERYKDMPLQEYLDREDTYSLMLFVDENQTLIKSVIEINDWIIRINDFEL